MSEIETGGPAFPTENGRQVRHGAYHFEVMTLRDYFAAKEMQAAVIAAASWGPCQFRDFDVDAVSEFANRQADAMLAARGEK